MSSMPRGTVPRSLRTFMRTDGLRERYRRRRDPIRTSGWIISRYDDRDEIQGLIDRRAAWVQETDIAEYLRWYRNTVRERWGDLPFTEAEIMVVINRIREERRAHGGSPQLGEQVFLDEEIEITSDPEMEKILTDDERDVNEPEAEGLQQNNLASNKVEEAEECAICLMPAELPVRMPCSHEFCFTCAKGLMKDQKRSCALCRKPIPPNFITNPETFATGAVEAPMGKYSWFYKSRSGWWAYAPRMQTDIENAFQSGKSTFECILNGQKYIFDFGKSIQTFGMQKIQHIKRSLSKRSHLGVAGLRYTVPS